MYAGFGNVLNLPIEDRPRERLIRQGVSALSGVELLAVIIGRGDKGQSVMQIAHNLVKQFGPLSRFNKLQFSDLEHVKGIGTAKACQILAAIEMANRLSFSQDTEMVILTSARSVFKLVSTRLKDKEVERFLLITLNARQRLIAVDQISVGIVNQSLVHPREIFKVAISRRASSVIFVHNHPSGDPTPSADDLAITKRLAKVGVVIGISVLDHIIIARNQYVSLKEDGVLDKMVL